MEIAVRFGNVAGSEESMKPEEINEYRANRNYNLLPVVKA